MRPSFAARLRSADGREIFHGRYALRTESGAYVGIEDRGLILRNAAGDIERVLGTLSLVETDFQSDERTSHLDRSQMRDAIDAGMRVVDDEIRTVTIPSLIAGGKLHTGAIDVADLEGMR